MDSLRILHVTPTYYSQDSVVGGGEKYILYMCSALRKGARELGKNVEVSILAFGSQVGRHIIGDDISCVVLSGEPWDPYSINLEELSAQIKHADVLVIHQCLSPFGLFIGSHAKLASKLVIGMDHGGGEHAMVSHSPEIGSIFDFFLAQSKFAANSFNDINSRVAVIPGPIDTEFYRPSPLKRDPKLVLAVGRILPHKGFDRIVRSCPPELKLLLIGSGYDVEYRQYLHEVGRNLLHFEIMENLSDTEVLHFLQTASLFVHASTHVDYRGRYYPKPELLGLAPLEALSCGTPALVSCAGALPELISIDGCKTFADDEELRALLQKHSRQELNSAGPMDIHNAVNNAYGLNIFGRNFMQFLANAGQKP